MGGSSWLTVVKRAFRSPTKDTHKKASRRSREDNDQEQDEDEKKREKRRWLFRKHSANNNASQQNEAQLTKKCSAPPPPPPEVLPPPHDHRHAIAVAAATAAAAEAAVATAQAAVEIIRLTRSSNPNPSSIKQNYAAIVIQKAFRGYLARRALVALRGIVKLQALIRGQNVRKQAKMTLRCMQALLRLQTRMHDHHHHHHLLQAAPATTTARLSQDGGSRKSMFAETTANSFWDSKYIAENIRERKSTSRDRRGTNSSIDWNWKDCPRTLLELEECLQSRKEAALKRESSSSSSSLAHAFSQKIWNPENEVGERTKWLEQWMETKQWKDEAMPPMSMSRVSTEKRDSFVKTVEMDTHTMNVIVTPKQSSAANVRKIHPHQNQKQSSTQSAGACPSPGRGGLKSINNFSTSVQPPSTPSPSNKARPPPAAAMRTPSPRGGLNKEDKSYSAANTPSLRSLPRLNSSSTTSRCGGNAGAGIPNYMAATASAKARVRSQSAPRQRPSTPERDRGGGGGAAFAKKRLCFPVPPPGTGREGYAMNMNFSESLRSPSFKSVQAGYVGMESCYTDSVGGEISPSSTTELRWWLR